jgi:hypothetical protein
VKLKLIVYNLVVSTSTVFAMSMASIIMLPVFAVPTVVMVTTVLSILTAIIVTTIVIPAVVVITAIVATTVYIGYAVTVNVALLNVTRAEVVVIARLHEINWP